jgi:HEAT repeat protein
MDDIDRRLISDDPEERRIAVPEIAGLPDSRWASCLVRALGDSNWRVRKEAVTAARSFAASRDVLHALVKVLGPGDNVGLRNATVEALASFGAAAVKALALALPELDADGRKLAAEVLARAGDSAAILLLEALFDDEDPNVRVAAIEAVAHVGAVDVNRAAVLLERCLLTRDNLSVLTALDGLNRLGVAVGWPLLKPHLANSVLRDAVLVAAGLSGNAEAAPHLVRALSSSHGRSFRTAVGALATFVAADPASRKATRAAMSTLTETNRRRLVELALEPSDDVEARRCVLLVVGALGTTEAADAVIEALADDRLAAEAEQALDMLGPAAILALARRARSGAPDERAACVEQLGRLADEGTRSIACQAILDAAADGAPDVVRAALGALAEVGDEATLGFASRWLSPDATPAVRKAASDALASAAARHPGAAAAMAREVRPESAEAAMAATVIGVVSSPIFESMADDIAFLAAAASNPSAIVRRAAVEALSRFFGHGAVAAASFGLTDEAPEVQLAAIRALGRMRDTQGRPVGVGPLLEAVHTFADERLGVSAIEALGETGDSSALEVLLAVTRGAAANRAVAAVEAIGRIEAVGRVDALILALSHAEPEVVKAALRVISKEERDPRAMAHVAASLDHETWDVRRLAAELLGRRYDSATRNLLRQRLILEREPLVRAEIQRSLQEVEGTTVRRSMPPLGGGAG